MNWLNKRNLSAALISSFLALQGCQTTTQSTLPALPAWQHTVTEQQQTVGTIIDTANGQAITTEQLLAALAQQQIVLIGEKHDNLDHHQLQLWLVQALAQYRTQGSVVLEMLNTTQQPLVDQLQQQLQQGQTINDVADALNWQSGWDWQQYGELVNYLVKQPTPLKGANFTRDELMAMYRNPPQLTGTQSTAVAVQTRLSEQINQSHCQQLPASQLPNMLAIQQQRDRLMAQVLVDSAKPTLLIAGGYHVRKDMGAPLHLTDLGATSAKVLMLVEETADLSNLQADYLWITPKAPEQDYCAQFSKARAASQQQQDKN